MAPRSELQALLIELTESENVYFQPPPTVKMEYPCIIYERDDINISHANNHPYRLETRYSLKVVSRDPDSLLITKVSQLPKCAYDRFFVSDGLNHDVFTLFF